MGEFHFPDFSKSHAFRPGDLGCDAMLGSPGRAATYVPRTHRSVKRKTTRTHNMLESQRLQIDWLHTKAPRPACLRRMPSARSAQGRTLQGQRCSLCGIQGCSPGEDGRLGEVRLVASPNSGILARHPQALRSNDQKSEQSSLISKAS